jgi:hypothetical protein
MSKAISKLAPAWWEYTTLDPDLLADSARIPTVPPDTGGACNACGGA